MINFTNCNINNITINYLQNQTIVKSKNQNANKYKYLKRIIKILYFIYKSIPFLILLLKQWNI